MAWTTPNTAVAGSLIRATDYNTYVRDNLTYLLQRPGQSIIRDNNANYTTTSVSFVDIDSTNLSITLSMNGSRALIGFTGTLGASGTGDSAVFAFTVDGTRVGVAGGYDMYQVAVNNIPYIGCAFTALVTGLAAGSHTFRVQWARTTTVYGGLALLAGNGSAQQDSVPNFWVLEV